MTEQTQTKHEATPEADLRLVIEVGNEHVEPGRTRVEVRADGRVLVSNRLEGTEDRAEGRIDPERIVRLVDRVTSERALRTTGERRGIPDEPRYRIELYRDGERVQTAELWRSEVEELPPLASLISELEAVVNEASRGKFVL